MRTRFRSTIDDRRVPAPLLAAIATPFDLDLEPFVLQRPRPAARFDLHVRVRKAGHDTALVAYEVRMLAACVWLAFVAHLESPDVIAYIDAMEQSRVCQVVQVAEDGRAIPARRRERIDDLGVRRR